MVCDSSGQKWSLTKVVALFSNAIRESFSESVTQLKFYRSPRNYSNTNLCVEFWNVTLRYTELQAKHRNLTFN